MFFPQTSAIFALNFSHFFSFQFQFLFPFSLQECVFENLEVKQNVFQEIEKLAGTDTILSSSTSCLVPSALFSGLQNRSRCLVAHPVSGQR